MSDKPQKIDIKTAFNLPPEKAVKYLENKGYKITNDWRELWEDAHAKAFTVAKMTDIKLLKDTKGRLETALKEGWSADKTQRELTNLFKEKGWWGKKTIKDENGEEKQVQLGSPYRVRTIYRQNIQSAYNAGRYLEILEDVDFSPNLQYICILDGQTRPEHRALHGKVMRHDDPAWAVILPPNGWGCRCTIRSLSDDEVKKRGLKVENSKGKISCKEVVINKETGETKQAAVFRFEDAAGRIINFQPDAGWSSNVGKAAWNIDVLAFDAVKDMPQALKDKFISDMAQNLHSQKVYENFISGIIKNGLKAKGIEKTVTWINPKTLSVLQKENISLKTPVVVMQDNRAGHIIGDVKVEKQRISEKQLKKLYEFINKPDEIYLDKEDNTILFVKKLQEKEVINSADCLKVAVKIDRYKKGRIPVNYLSTAGRVSHKSFNNSRYIKIE